jgi:RNA polymerase sigma-70 factor (ECF subfamily)
METPGSLLERLKLPAQEAAWDRFVRIYTPFIFHWARQAGLQPADAADLVQGVLTTLIQKLPEFTYDRQKSFRAWLRTITLNQWRDFCRRRALRSCQGVAEDFSDAAVSGGQDSFAEAEYRTYLVARALELMRSEFQENTWRACWEFVACGRSVAEVARELGISENAVYLAKGRVLARLREELKDLVE